MDHTASFSSPPPKFPYETVDAAAASTAPIAFETQLHTPWTPKVQVPERSPQGSAPSPPPRNVCQFELSSTDVLRQFEHLLSRAPNLSHEMPPQSVNQERALLLKQRPARAEEALSPPPITVQDSVPVSTRSERPRVAPAPPPSHPNPTHKHLAVSPASTQKHFEHDGPPQAQSLEVASLAGDTLADPRTPSPSARASSSTSFPPLPLPLPRFTEAERVRIDSARRDTLARIPRYYGTGARPHEHPDRFYTLCPPNYTGETGEGTGDGTASRGAATSARVTAGRGVNRGSATRMQGISLSSGMLAQAHTQSLPAGPSRGIRCHAPPKVCWPTNRGEPTLNAEL